MAPTTPTASHSSMYERMSGNCTRLLASRMLSTISPAITPTSYVLDNACGPGIVTEQIKLQHSDVEIMAADHSEGMIDETKRRAEKEGWKNVQTELLDIRDLKSLPDETFTHAVMNLGLPVPGDPEGGVKAVREMFRILKPEGVAMMSTWADSVWPSAFLSTASTIRPQSPPQNLMAIPAPQMRASWLATALEEGGFGNNIEVRPCVTYTSAKSMEELVSNMMLAKGIFFGGYSDEELRRAQPIFGRELRALRTFEEGEWGVRVGMKAWIGVGWKRGDEGVVAM